MQARTLKFLLQASKGIRKLSSTNRTLLRHFDHKTKMEMESKPTIQKPDLIPNKTLSIRLMVYVVLLVVSPISVFATTNTKTPVFFFPGYGQNAYTQFLSNEEACYSTEAGISGWWVFDLNASGGPTSNVCIGPPTSLAIASGVGYLATTNYGWASIGYGCLPGYTMALADQNLACENANPDVSPVIPEKNPAGNSCPSNSVGNPTNSVGNPINFITGNKFIDEVDSSESVSSPLKFVRHYNSSHSYQLKNRKIGTTFFASPLGSGWFHSYSQSLEISSLFVKYTLDTGQAIYFHKDISWGWLADADINYQLQEIIPTNGGVSTWKVTTPNDDVEIFNSDGDLQLIKNRNGLTQALTFSSDTTSKEIAPHAKLLISVSDSFNRRINFTYNSSGKMVTMTDPAGNITVYSFDTNGNLSTVAYPDSTPNDLKNNPTKTYIYGELANSANINQPNALTGIIDEKGVRYATYQYDANGKAISTEHAGGVEKYSLSYSVDSTNTTVTDPLNSVRTNKFTTVLGVLKSTGTDQPGGSGCGAASNAITYDTNGNITSRTDFNGITTTYSYDLTRNLETSRTEAAGTAEARTISIDWHPQYRLPLSITELGLKTSYRYDAKGNITQKTLTDLVTKTTRQWNTSYTYSATGQIISKIEDGPRTDVKDLNRYDYYGENATCTEIPLGCRGQLKQVTNPLGHTTSISRYNASGAPLTIINPNGLETNLTYDERQRVTSLDMGGEKTVYTYDPTGQLTRITLANGATLDYHYDNAHRLIQVNDQLGNNLQYSLDNMGNRINEELSDANGQLTRTQSRAYDALSRLQTLNLPQ